MAEIGYHPEGKPSTKHHHRIGLYILHDFVKPLENTAIQSHDLITHGRRYKVLTGRWIRFWLRYSGPKRFGRIAARFVSWFAPPHKAGVYLARISRRGYIDPTATVYHSNLRLGDSVFVGEHVLLFQNQGGGVLELGDRVCIYRNCILETAQGGTLVVEEDASIHPRCQLNAYKGSIHIGRGTMIAPNCAFYPYDHGTAPGLPIRHQPLHSKGDIIIGSEAWLGVGVIVLGGVKIGDGVAIAAGSVVTHDIPDNTIAWGIPAKVMKNR